MTQLQSSSGNEGIEESRFYMWRAVFAMVHADGVVAKEEKEFVEHYLDAVAFSDEQAAILREDLKTPQDVGEMLAKVTNAEDRGQFFQFSRLLIWCDGDLDAQEQKILDGYLGDHMKSYDSDDMRELFRESRNDVEKWRTAMEEEIEGDSDGGGIHAAFKTMFGD